MKRICLHRGCNLIAASGSYCQAHKPTREDHRPPVTMRAGYGKEWIVASRRQLSAFPRCQRCNAPATDVHHILPVRQGGTHDPSNLISLCASCHMSIEPRQNAISVPKGRGD